MATGPRHWRGTGVARCIASRATLAAILAVFLPTSIHADWQDDVGFTSLQARLGGAAPTGTFIDVTQVEATSDPNNYVPDPANAEFVGKTIIPLSGPGDPWWHGTTVGRYYYGLSTSMTPGITQIDAYEANDWFKRILATQPAGLPAIETRRIQNFSWVGSKGITADTDALRRVDLVVHRDGVFIAAGVDNDIGTVMPPLVASAYNAMTVGLTNGDSSYGPTLVDLAGRVKPNIVAPIDATSWAAPIVASAAALLLDTAEIESILPSLDPTDRRVAIATLCRALLMTGATKDEFADWRKGFATPSTDGTVPLDYRYGAGELNIDNSHRILTQGQQSGGSATDVPPVGWDWTTVAPTQPNLYVFEIPPRHSIDRLAITAAWNRHIDTGERKVTLTPSLADIDLAIYEADGFTPTTLLDQSISAIDNVEHLYLCDLPEGRYAIELTTDQPWPVALAWDIHVLAPLPGDADNDRDIDLDDVAAFIACMAGPDQPPSTPDCLYIFDADTDDDIDLADFAVLAQAFTGPVASASGTASIQTSFDRTAAPVTVPIPKLTP